ncbi:hypothetical protein HMPREF9151_00492 [Hoylesella saccharolytica F0055]|uniref:Transposase IS200-like domain-containing protein n=1 Tax=Hoylesella saccharolytica F0055 TaxID=1127699 RepID=L1NI66_9BACT|nr:transposase [Hoylesella saccharolytica]EKY03073.1 hypothetical protein HMPREF9151_00492 [Hoylesella saccharolytica F0055]
MPHSLTHLLIHCVYHKGRYAPIIREEDQYRLNGFIIEQSKHLKSHCLIANGPGDHIHLLVALSANIALSQFIKEIKKNINRVSQRMPTRLLPFLSLARRLCCLFGILSTQRSCVCIHFKAERTSPKTSHARRIGTVIKKCPYNKQ